MIAERAAVVHERYRPKGRFEGRRSWLGGALFWVLLLSPALTAVGFATYFTACLFQNMVSGTHRAGLVFVSLIWFALSIGLGLILFMGVMGLHGGVDEELYFVLLAINIVFTGVGWLLSLGVKKFGRTQQAAS